MVREQGGNAAARRREATARGRSDRPRRDDWREQGGNACINDLPLGRSVDEAIRELRRLVRHRQALVDQGRAVKLRVAALLRDHRMVRPPELKRTWTRRHRAWLQWLLSTELLPPISRQLLTDWLVDLEYLEGRVVRAEAQLRQAVEGDRLVDWLLQQPCVGLVTACVLRAEIGSFDRFCTGKQLSRYCGVTPRNASSGQRQADAGLIAAGNQVLKATLTELAHRLMTYVPRWQEFRARLRAAGKPPCVIVAAEGE